MSALKDKLQQARRVVNIQRDATMQMADRVIAKGAEVERLRERAEGVHMSDLSGQMADLSEFADELAIMGNGEQTGSDDGEKVAVVGSTPGTLAKTAWTGTDGGTAYDGTTDEAPKT